MTNDIETIKSAKTRNLSWSNIIEYSEKQKESITFFKDTTILMSKNPSLDESSQKKPIKGKPKKKVNPSKNNYHQLKALHPLKVK